MLEFIIGIPVGAIIGWLVREIISDRLARDRGLEAIRITEFNKAAAEFRIAFINEKRFLDPNSLADRTGNTAFGIVQAAIDLHEIAMIRFEPFVCKSETEAYKKAWKDYAGDSRHCEQYRGSTAIEKEKMRNLALERINNLLKFAELIH